MSLFYRYELKQMGDSYEIILYVDKNSTEFAAEYGIKTRQKHEKLKASINQFIKEKFPAIKISTAKVMLGTMLFASISLTANEKVEASDTGYINMSYLYFGDTGQFIDQVNQTKGTLNEVSPSYFNLNEDGSLYLTPKLDQEFIDEMHERGMKVTPFLSNHWNKQAGRNALDNREVLSDRIVEVIEEYDLDGINVDIENVTEKDRENYTDFIRLLREKLPTLKSVSVAVAANPNGWTEGWHGSYDYEQLGEYADYLMIMAYDESYPGGPEGPIASESWVEKGINYALNEGVPSEKIVLGLPFYGRYWIEGEASGGSGLSQQRIQEMINMYDGTVIYDEEKESAKAIVTINENDPKLVISGKELKAGTYNIWFENKRSLEAKVNLVNKYHLKGTGSWALGQEDPEIWSEYSSWLDQSVIQTPSYQLQTDYVSNWAKEHISFVKEQGWMVGQSEKVFKPNDPLTRRQVAIILTRLLQLESVEPIPNDGYFADTPDDDQEASAAIALVNQHGYMVGKENDLFDPNSPITREQMAVVFHRILEEKSNSEIQGENNNPYIDLSNERWSFEAINALNKLEIMSGYPDTGEFKPTNPITRAQMAKMIHLSSDQLLQ